MKWRWPRSVLPAADDPIRAALAQRIIALAKADERDPERLCDGALRTGGQAAET